MAAHVGARVLGLLSLVVVARLTGESAHRSLVRWDASWYRHIAEGGYGASRVAADGRTLKDYAFFPLYPGLERLLSEISGLQTVDAGLVISAAASVVAAVGIFQVGTQVFDERTGVVLTVAWSVLPVSVVQSMAYAESLFTALVAWCLLATLRHRYVAAGLLAALGGLTRPLGGAAAATVIACAALELRSVRARVPRSPGDRRELARLVAGAGLAATGTLGFLTFVAIRQGSVLGYFAVADQWGNDVDGGVAFLGWTGRMLVTDDFLAGLLLLCALAVLLLQLALMVRDRYPIPLLVFTLTSVVLTFSTSGYFGSKPRYLLPVFPLLMPLAAWLSRIRAGRAWAALAGAALGSSVYGAVWLFGPGPP